MPTRGSKDPNGRALRGRRAHTTFASSVDPAAQIWSNYNVRSGANGAATPEQPAVQNCLYDRFEALYKKSSIKPSLVIVPARFKSGTLYSEIPTSGNGDFTVTRAGGGVTRVNASGLIESAKTNLALQSENFLTTWSTAGTNISVSTGTTAAFTAPDGTTNADLLTATASGSARIIQSFSFVSGTTYTYSAFAKAGSGFFGLTLENGGVASGAAVIWNLNTGALAVSGTAGAGYTLQSQGIENYGNGWYRCRMTVLLGLTVAGNMRANTSDGTMSSAIIQSASGNTAYVWGAQLEEGSSASEYIPTTTVARTRFSGVTVDGTSPSGIPRLDYFASGGVVGCPALLVEPSGSNVIVQSQNWIASGWRSDATANVTTVSATTGTLDPSGTYTANAISPTSGSATHLKVGNDGSSSFTSGTIYTQSGFFKQGTGNAGRYIQLTYPAARFTQEGYANFDLQLGTVAVVSGTSADTNRAAGIENYGNGWYRCRFTATCNNTGTGNGFSAILITASGDTRAPSFTGTTTDILYGWGAQTETGSVATSYIPTTTGSITRNADVVAVSGAVSGSIGQQSGTIYIECQSGFATNDIIVINTAGQSPGNNYVAITKTATNVFRLSLIASGTTILIDQASAITSFAKIAVAYASGNTALFINGTQIGSTDTTGFSFNAALNNITFISNMVSGTKTTRIRAVALYTERLTNDQLASLTTP